MTLKYRLDVHNDQKNAIETISGELNDDEYELLGEFVTYTKEVVQTDFIKKRDAGSFSIRHKAGEAVEFDVQLPDWNDAMLFIYKLRPLILENEPTSFHRIRSMLERRFDSDMIRGFLSYQKHIFFGKRELSGIQIRSNDTLLNSDAVLQKYLNGFEYHRDRDKQQFINDLHHIFPLDVSKVIFLRLLTDKMEAIANVADLIEVIFGKQKEIGLSFKAKSDSPGG